MGSRFISNYRESAPQSFGLQFECIVCIRVGVKMQLLVAYIYHDRKRQGKRNERSQPNNTEAEQHLDCHS